MYLLGVWVIGTMNLVFLISGLASRNTGAIIGVIVFVPIFSVGELVVLRIICEVCVVILLLPYYIQKLHAGGGGGSSAGGESSSGSRRLQNYDDEDEIDCSVHSKIEDEEDRV
jgi:hypothetical protein